MRYLLLFLPQDVTDQIATLLIMLAGLCMIVGARRVAFGLLLSAIALSVLPRAVDPLVEAGAEDFGELLTELGSGLPWWLPAAGAIVIGLVAMRWMLAATIGRGAADHAMGEIVAALVVRAIVLLVSLPFKILGAVLRALLQIRK